MEPERKARVQSLLFDLLVTMDPMVGDIIEIGFGLVFTALMQHHGGDLKLVEAGMRECLEQCLAGIKRIEVQNPGILVAGNAPQKLDS